MGLLKTVDTVPYQGVAGAAHTQYILVQLDPDLMERMDADAADVQLAYDIYGATDGLLKKSGTLTRVPNLTNEYLWSATVAFLLAEAIAGAYLVKVRMSADLDFGDDAEQAVIDAAGGNELDTDDVASVSRLFSLK